MTFLYTVCAFVMLNKQYDDHQNDYGLHPLQYIFKTILANETDLSTVQQSVRKNNKHMEILK